MAKKGLRGVFSFTATPMRDDGATIDLDRLRSHLDWQTENGVHGIAVLGSTGSNGSFSEKEREELIRVTVKHVNGRLPVMAGTGSITNGLGRNRAITARPSSCRRLNVPRRDPFGAGSPPCSRRAPLNMPAVSSSTGRVAKPGAFTG